MQRPFLTTGLRRLTRGSKYLLIPWLNVISHAAMAPRGPRKKHPVVRYRYCEESVIYRLQQGKRSDETA